MEIKPSIVRVLAATCLIFLSAPGHAVAINVNGKIASIWLAQAGNFSFRIYVHQGTTDQLSACNNGFAYLNTDDDNYAAKTAALLTAYSTNKNVSVSMDKDANNWCRITDFIISG
jgi:hypothetical protein